MFIIQEKARNYDEREKEREREIEVMWTKGQKEKEKMAKQEIRKKREKTHRDVSVGCANKATQEEEYV